MRMAPAAVVATTRPRRTAGCIHSSMFKGGAAGMALEVDAAVVDEVEERLAADEDDVLWRDGARVATGQDDAASIRTASVATPPIGYVTGA